jgi:hypothetical protein
MIHVHFFNLALHATLLWDFSFRTASPTIDEINKKSLNCMKKTKPVKCIKIKHHTETRIW